MVFPVFFFRALMNF